MKGLRLFALIASFILIVSLACSFGNVSTPQPDSPSEPPAATPETQSGSGGISNLDNVKNAVVQIEAVGTFIDPQFGLVVNGAGRGSGFIIDPSGIAVTNNHVVTGAATLKVWIDGEQRSARVLGASECADLAVIKIDGADFQYLNWYDGQVSTGMEVFSAGFPLGEPQFTLTKGIISKEKADGQTDWSSIDYVLSHDATINPGNSGGPLISSDGQVVGVNYRSRPDFNQYFAIDPKTSQSIIAQLREGNDVQSIGINGVAVVAEDGSLSGIWVSSVKSGSAADKAGVKAGDILYQMEGLVLATDGTMKDYCDILRSHNSSDTLSLTVIRYATYEILEGQLNGRTLEATGYFGDSGTGSTGSSGSTGGSASGQEFFVEEFDVDPQWYYEVILGNDNSDAEQATYSFDFGKMIFDILGKQLYAYYIYEGQQYEDVRVDISVDNRGVNSQQVSLICRSSDEGWYEFAVQSDGLWELYAISNGYNRIANGGSTAVKQGKAVNQYTFSCDGEKLSFFINGVEPKGSPYMERKYALRRGSVGFAISSLNVTPVNMEVDWFEVSQP
ncbi:MAG: trypsin-like peptidase domain-containing protein [Anaerolineae bacterium]|nr:trypsin-like peptidase domain-containing protein [Anaerolineae bacterium]